MSSMRDSEESENDVSISSEFNGESFSGSGSCDEAPEDPLDVWNDEREEILLERRLKREEPDESANDSGNLLVPRGVPSRVAAKE